MKRRRNISQAQMDAESAAIERTESAIMTGRCTCGHFRVTHCGTIEAGGWGHDGHCALASCDCRAFQDGSDERD